MKLRRFIAWLKWHRLDSVIGECGSCRECPIASWIGQIKGRSDGRAAVQNCSWRIAYGKFVSVRTPRWAKRFIIMVDHKSPSRYITAGVALNVLRELGYNVD